MENSTIECMICLEGKQKIQVCILPLCQHVFCPTCLKQYINILRKYNLLTPQKLSCIAQDCKQQIPDQIILKLYPGEQGFILTTIRKRYKQSKDPSVTIFNCRGFIKSNRQLLVDKPSTMDRSVHSKLMIEKVRRIQAGEQQKDKKTCTNIMSYNQFNSKEKLVQCYVCGLAYCSRCGDFLHQGKCELSDHSEKELQKFNKNKALSNNQTTTNNSLNTYIQANSLTCCLNPKCGLAIAKQEGCFWVKCRCSWQFCYPCKKLWGDCEHFAKYPYKKFVPPPEWMVKALGLY